MLRIRIAGAGALAALAIAVSVNLAAAQTADPAGPPLKLLAGLSPPHAKTHAAKSHAAATSPHAKTARKKVAHASDRKIAAKKRTHHREPAIASAGESAPASAPTPQPAETAAQSVSAALPANAWAADPAPAAVSAPIVDATAAAQPAPTASATDDSPVKEVVVDGRTVQVAAPDQVNDMDLAAKNDSGNEPASAANVAAFTPSTQTVLAAPVHTERSQIGSGSWIAQVLAALGGAVAAGAVAWFLIGSGPVRLYG